MKIVVRIAVIAVIALGSAQFAGAQQGVAPPSGAGGGGVNSAPAPASVVSKVKALYASAAYEDALAVLASLPADTPMPELDQYRAFCLIALGDEQRAQAAIARLLTHSPLYEPDGEETSPRVIEMFREVRTQVLPTVAKQLYLDAKTSLEGKQREDAIEGFETLLELLAGQSTADPTLDDIKVLAEGFLDLSRALPDPASEKAPAAGPPAEGPANASAPVVAEAEWTRPVAVRQQMPPWHAPDAISRQTEFKGVVRVKIGDDGKVVSSEMVRSIHPLYDRLLLSASRNWLYQPARQDGKPVPAELLVEVSLRPED